MSIFLIHSNIPEVVESKKRIVTRAFIENESGGVLIGLRAGGNGANQWALIGGKADEGESLEDCIVREVFEETGLKFFPVFIKKVIDDSHNQAWEVYLFRGRAEGEIVLDTRELLEVMYVGRMDIDELDIAFNHRDLLEAFFREG